MRLNSLAFRLFASAAAWTLVVVPIAAILLISLYRQTVERSFDARLNVYLTSLVASTTAGGATHRHGAHKSRRSHLRPSPSPAGIGRSSRSTAAERPLFVSDSLLDQQLELPSQDGITPDQNLTRRALCARSARPALAHCRARDPARRR